MEVFMTSAAMYDVKDCFPDYAAQAVAGSPVEVTESGKPVVYIVGAEYFMKMSRPAPSGFGDAYDNWRKTVLSEENEFPFDAPRCDDIGARGMEWLNEK
jgi:prevent-host-death family protein